MPGVDEVCEDLRKLVLSLPPRTNLGKQWQLSRRYNVGITKLSYILRLLAAEGWIEPKSGIYGGYFTPARRRRSRKGCVQSPAEQAILHSQAQDAFKMALQSGG